MAQGFVSTEYVTKSDMKSHDSDRLGRGDMLRIRGRHTIPLSVKRDSIGGVTA